VLVKNNVTQGDPQYLVNRHLPAYYLPCALRAYAHTFSTDITKQTICHALTIFYRYRPIGTNPFATAAPRTLFFPYEKRPPVQAFRIRTPKTPQWAAREKYQCSYAWSIVKRMAFYIKNMPLSLRQCQNF
jgi:hypothetical protein